MFPKHREYIDNYLKHRQAHDVGQMKSSIKDLLIYDTVIEAANSIVERIEELEKNMKHLEELRDEINDYIYINDIILKNKDN